MKRIKKGEYGYRNSMRRGRVMKIAVLTLFILAQLAPDGLQTARL